MTSDELVNLLPHGSGINGDWTIEEKSGKWLAYNFYEPMTETGFYNGVVDFVLTIPKRNPMDFNLHFLGKEAQYLNRKHDLRGYLEDTFAYSLESIAPELLKPRAKKLTAKRKSNKRSSGTLTSVRGMR